MKILYYATYNSYTHLGCAHELAKRMPGVKFYVASAEKWPFAKTRNVTEKKLTKPNCSIRLIDTKFRLNCYPYEKEDPDVLLYRKHVGEFVSYMLKLKPNLVIVDLTYEIAMVAKLFGFPVFSFYETIQNDQQRIKIAFDSADSVIARYPKEFVSEIEAEGFVKKYSDKIFFTGGLSRFDASEKITKTESCRKIGIASENPVVLFMASSKPPSTASASNYYNTILEAMNQDDIESIVLFPDKAKAAELSAKFKKVKIIAGNFQNNFDIINAADIVLTPGGLGSVMESSLLKKPMIILPAPWIFDEQNRKAAVLKKMGVADVVRTDSGFSPESVRQKIKNLLEDKNIQERMIAKQSSLIDGRGYERLAKHVENFLKSEKAKNTISI